MSLKRHSTDSHILKELKENRPHKDGLYTESLDYVYYYVSFEFFDCEGASTERHFIVRASKLPT